MGTEGQPREPSCRFNFAIVPLLSLRHGKTAMAVDFGKTASDYAQYRAGFPEQFFDRLFQSGIAAKTDRVLGRIRASAGVGASLPPDGIARFDVAHRELLEQRFPSD